MERQFRLNWNAIVEEAKQRRKSQHLTQERIAILAGISTPTVSRFEGGEKDIQLSSVLNLLRILGMLDERVLNFEQGTEYYDALTETVVFFASDDARRITCRISREALADVFKASEIDNKKEKKFLFNPEELLTAFRKNYKIIKHKVYMKYLSNKMEPDHTILIKYEDFS